MSNKAKDWKSQTLKAADFIKQAFEVVGLKYNLANVAVLLGILLAPLTTSTTLQWFIIVFGLLGGVSGYFFVVTSYKRTTRSVCLHKRRRYLAIFWIPLLFSVMMILILKPEIAERHQSLESVRDFLLDAILLSNLIISCGIGVGLFFLIGAITLSSPKLVR